MFIKKALLALLIALSFGSAAQAQSSWYGSMLDYRVEVQYNPGFQYLLKYDTNQPIQHLSQININHKAFSSQAEADEFLMLHPTYTKLNLQLFSGLRTPYISVGTVNSFDQAEALEEEIRQDYADRHGATCCNLKVKIVAVPKQLFMQSLR